MYIVRNFVQFKNEYQRLLFDVLLLALQQWQRFAMWIISCDLNSQSFSKPPFFLSPTAHSLSIHAAFCVYTLNVFLFLYDVSILRALNHRLLIAEKQFHLCVYLCRYFMINKYDKNQNLNEEEEKK